MVRPKRINAPVRLLLSIVAGFDGRAGILLASRRDEDGLDGIIVAALELRREDERLVRRPVDEVGAAVGVVETGTCAVG